MPRRSDEGLTARFLLVISVERCECVQDAVEGTPERKAQSDSRISESPDTTPSARRPRFGVWVRDKDPPSSHGRMT